MHRLPTLVLALLSVPLLVLPVQADLLRPFTPRMCAIQSECIVLAEPLQQAVLPTRYRVLEVLRGTAVKPGQALELDDRGLGDYDREKYADERNAGRKLKDRTIQQALLFVSSPRRTATGVRFMLPGPGLCLRTTEGEVLAPSQWMNPGPYVLTPFTEIDWFTLLGRVRQDCAALDRLFYLKALPPSARRTRDLLEWVEQHRREFGIPNLHQLDHRSSTGWEHLEKDIFQWVLADSDPESCWAAVRLHAELNQGRPPPLYMPAFGTTQGRALLTRIALQPTLLEGDRARALGLLSEPETLWPDEMASRPGAHPLDAEEQSRLIERLLPLLQDASEEVRAAAARALIRLSDPAPADPTRQTRRALPALLDAYRTAALDSARDEMAEALCRLGGPRYWQEVSGNPPGLLVRLRDLQQEDGKVRFWLQRRTSPQAIEECPTLILERLEPTGRVAERRSMPLPVRHMAQPWSAGWKDDTLVMVEFPLADFPAGTWRLRVEGKVGPPTDRMIWRAEPRTITLAPPAPQQPSSPAVPMGS